MIQSHFKYPFDRTGNDPNNLVRETQECTPTIRALPTVEGPFYTKSVVVKHNGRVLKRGTDYQCLYLHQEVTAVTGLEVCGVVKIINRSINGKIEIQYQVVGGYQVARYETIQQLANLINGDDRSTSYESIINLPKAFIPTPHLHSVRDLTGIEPIVHRLDEVVRAIEQLRSFRNIELYRLIGNVHTRVNEFLSSFKDNSSGIDERIRLLEFKVGDSGLVKQNEYDSFVERTLNRSAAQDAKILEMDSRYTSKFFKIQPKLDAMTLLADTVTARLGSLEHSRDHFVLTAEYEGEHRENEYLRVLKQENGYKIVHKDPAWLPQLLSAATDVVNLQNAQRALEGRQGELQTEVSGIHRTTSGLRNDLTETDNRVNALSEAIDQKIASARLALETSLNVSNERLDRHQQAILNIPRQITDVATPMIENRVAQSTAELTVLIDGVRQQSTTAKNKAEDISRRLETIEVAQQNNEAFVSAVATPIAERLDEVLREELRNHTTESIRDLKTESVTPLAEQMRDNIERDKQTNRAFQKQLSGRFFHHVDGSDTEYTLFYNEENDTISKQHLFDNAIYDVGRFGQTGEGVFTLRGRNVSSTTSVFFPYVRNNYLEVSLEAKLSSQESNIELFFEGYNEDKRLISLQDVVTGVDDVPTRTRIPLDTLTWTQTTEGTDGWVKLKGLIEPGWFKSAVGELDNGTKPFYGTSFFKVGVVANTGDRAQDSTTVSFSSLVIRPVSAPVQLSDIPGVNRFLESWFQSKVTQNAERPAASRWDLSRIRIQPGAESFSSVHVDDNDNLRVEGIVYYDTLGEGERGLFSPTATISVSSSQQWLVPEAFTGRLALVAVRSSSRTERGQVIHSAVKQTFVKLTGGTRIPIQVGDISSFGTYLTVSNAVDYPDAIYPRVTSPAGSPLQPGLVTIYV